jgi:hypothetical protein
MGYPIGSLLLWVRRRQAETLALGQLKIDAPAYEDSLWAVDGQQRITSLADALHPQGHCMPRIRRPRTTDRSRRSPRSLTEDATRRRCRRRCAGSPFAGPEHGEKLAVNPGLRRDIDPCIAAHAGSLLHTRRPPYHFRRGGVGGGSRPGHDGATRPSAVGSDARGPALAM